MPVMRLDKLISNSGLAQRSQVKRLVREGRITVNGRIAADAATHCDTAWDIRLDGQKAVWREFLYLMMNKPAGYLSVTEDPGGKRCLTCSRRSTGGSIPFPWGDWIWIQKD